MAAGKKRDQNLMDDVVLPYDRPAHFASQPRGQGARLVESQHRAGIVAACI